MLSTDLRIHENVSGLGVCIYNLMAGELEIGGSLGLPGQPA